MLVCFNKGEKYSMNTKYRKVYGKDIINDWMFQK